MAVTVEPSAVLASTADLMAYRLRVRAFAEGRGGVVTPTFTEETTPTLARAQAVAMRQADLTTNDFAAADAGDLAELVTIAALRTAIELETSVPEPNFDRVREWRLQLREYVGRMPEEDASGGEPGEGGGALEPRWSFGVPPSVRVEGSEAPLCSPRRREW